MNKLAIVTRCFHRLNKSMVTDILVTKGLYPTDKKKYNKRELLPYFQMMAETISEEELISYIEFIVTKKTKGLPAFTHKLNNPEFFENCTPTELRKAITRENNVVSNSHQVTSIVEDMNGNLINMLFIVKCFGYQWFSGEQTIDKLTAIYNCRVKIDLNKKIVTIFSGEDEVHEIIENFLTSVIRLSITNYRIKGAKSTLSWTDNASFKTALFLDLVDNRLKAKKVSASFKEVKFKVGNDDIKDVTINGKDIINSYLGCEYVTLGKDIVQFRLNIAYNSNNFTCHFGLKGKEQDILKIVVTDTDNEELRNKVVELIQEEYIDMCTNGISDIVAIQTRLEKIYIKYQEKESFFNEVIEEHVLSNIGIFSGFLSNLTDNDSHIVQKFMDNNKVILETLNSQEKDKALSEFSVWLQKKSESVR